MVHGLGPTSSASPRASSCRWAAGRCRRRAGRCRGGTRGARSLRSASTCRRVSSRKSTLTDERPRSCAEQADPDVIGPEHPMRDAESAVVTRRSRATRRATLGRRLRDGLLVDDVPQAVPGRGAQGRPQLRRRPRRRGRHTAICTAVVRASPHGAGLRVVAQGVADGVAGRGVATGLGCELAQGYLFGLPEPSETFGERPDAKQWAARLRRAEDRQVEGVQAGRVRRRLRTCDPL